MNHANGLTVVAVAVVGGLPRGGGGGGATLPSVTDTSRSELESRGPGAVVTPGSAGLLKVQPAVGRQGGAVAVHTHTTSGKERLEAKKWPKNTLSVKDGVVVVFFFASGLPPPFPWGRLGAPEGRPPPPPPPPFAGTAAPAASDPAASEDPVFFERGLR
ncbi:hypothetical protein EYF80_049666 [Liparis tanakae]|uniref:Uncharacterized protein n=1 Tax=Liparis tanakae TaxID=230148 RepID=A0A4Z2FG23_9TELE|nr:hypothetical protein EYF80_049666 [Liparis tanakae]